MNKILQDLKNFKEFEELLKGKQSKDIKRRLNIFTFLWILEEIKDRLPNNKEKKIKVIVRERWPTCGSKYKSELYCDLIFNWIGNLRNEDISEDISSYLKGIKIGENIINC